MDARCYGNLVMLAIIALYCSTTAHYAQAQTLDSVPPHAGTPGKASTVSMSRNSNAAAAATPATATTSPTSPTSTSNTSNTPSSETKTPSRSFKTGIQKVEFSLEKLREVNDDLKRMTKSVNSLNDEVSIQPMSLITQPEAVAGNIINLPVAVQGTGDFIPARTEKVNHAMSSLKPMVADMKAHADAYVSNTNQIDLSIPVSAEISPLLKEWIVVVHRLSKEEQRLEQLTVGPSYDNLAIARITGFIQEDIKKLELNRREMVKAIRKQEKVESKRK
jgi:hypothetical protein